MEILIESSSNISRTSMQRFLAQAKPIIMMAATTSDGDYYGWPHLRVIELEPGKWGAVADPPKKLAEWEIKARLFSLADGFCHKMEVANVGMGSGDL